MQRKPLSVISLRDARRINSTEDGSSSNHADLSVKREFSPLYQIEEIYIFLRDIILLLQHRSRLPAQIGSCLFSRLFIPLASTMWFPAFFL